MDIARLQQTPLWEITQRLISFDTVSSKSNLAAAEYLANLLDEQHFSVQLYKETIEGVQKATVIACLGPQEPGGLIISGHTDIVPFEGQPGWQGDPLTLRTDGQDIFGRGVTDMKAFLAQAIIAAQEVSLKKLRRPLIFLFTCDEEVAGQGSGRLIQVLPQLMGAYPLPEFALIGEPTNFAIFPAHKGYATFDVVVQGRGGHSSVPDLGLNAIVNMAQAIQSIQALHKRLQASPSPENLRLFPVSPSSTFNCGTIRGGLEANMIAETCRLTVSIRIAPGDQVGHLVELVRAEIERDVTRPMQAIAPECGARIENVIAVPPMQSPVDSPFSDQLSLVMRQPVERGAPFATDGGFFQQIGIHSYICGPGLLEKAHQPNESLPLINFVVGAERLKSFIEVWCIKNDLLA